MGSSRSASGRRDLALPDSLRGELKKPLGPVLTGKALVRAVSGHPVVAVSLNERAPRESKIGLTMRQPGLGKLDWLEEDRRKGGEARKRRK